MGELQEASWEIGGVWDGFKNGLHFGDTQLGRSVGRYGCGSSLARVKWWMHS